MSFHLKNKLNQTYTHLTNYLSKRSWHNRLIGHDTHPQP